MTFDPSRVRWHKWEVTPVPLTKFGENRPLHARDISDQSVARRKKEERKKEKERRKKETGQKQNLAEVIGKWICSVIFFESTCKGKIILAPSIDFILFFEFIFKFDPEVTWKFDL